MAGEGGDGERPYRGKIGAASAPAQTDVGFLLTDPRDYPRLLSRVKNGGFWTVWTFTQALEILDAGGPSTQVGVRIYDGPGWRGDDNVHIKQNDPIAWVDAVEQIAIQQIGPKRWAQYRSRIFVIAGNEPHETTYWWYMTWSYRAMVYARSRSIRLAIGAFGQGHPVGYEGFGPYPIIRQIRDLLHVVDENDRPEGYLPDQLRDGWHVLDLHEYGDLVFGDPRCYEGPWFYHVGRFKFWESAFYQEGEVMPWFVIGEFPFDSSLHSEAKGIHSLLYATDWTLDELLDVIRYYIVELYASHLHSGRLLGICWFGYGRDWPAYEVEEDPAIVDFLSGTIEFYTTDEPAPDSDPEPASTPDWWPYFNAQDALLVRAEEAMRARRAADLAVLDEIAHLRAVLAETRDELEEAGGSPAAD